MKTKSQVWESVEGDIEVWIEDNGYSSGKRVVFKHKDSNMSQGIYLEEAEAIHHAIAYFKNTGVMK